MQHLSFVVRPQAAFEALMARLKAHGVDYMGPSKMVSGPGYSIYFYDPHGARLEASCDHIHDEPAVLRDATQSRDKAIEELRTLCDDPQWIARVTKDLS